MATERKYRVIAYVRDETRDKRGLLTFEEAVILKERLDAAADPDTLYLIEDTEEAE